MGLKDSLGGSNDNDQQSMGGEEQKKTLVANLYSTDQHDKYKNISDWDWFDERAYHVTADGGLLRRNLKRITPSGSHEEWYTRFQLYLAHYVGELVDQPVAQGTNVETEPEGPVPLMEFLGFDSSDIYRFLEANPEMAEELFKMVEEGSPAAEEAEADD